MIEADIYNTLASDAAVQAIVGDRIRPLQARIGDAHPLIVYALVDRTPEGDVNCESDIEHAELIVDSYSLSYSQALNLDAAAYATLRATDGRYPRVIGSSKVGSVYTEGVDDHSYVLVDDNDAVLYRRRRTLIIWFEPNS